MRRFSGAVVLGVGLTWFCSLLPASAQLVGGGGGAERKVAEPPRAERPTYAVGDRWVRSDGAYDLVRIDKDIYVFSAGPGHEIQLTRDLVVWRVVKDGVLAWEIHPAPRLTWPLQMGKWGVTTSLLRTREVPAGVRVRATWKVEAYETIRVVAGALPAYRIVYSFERETALLGDRRGEQPGRSQFTVVDWYAPGPALLVKSEMPDPGSLSFQVVAIDRPATGQLSVLLEGLNDQARVATEEVSVGGKVVASAGVGQVLATVNGVEVFAKRASKGGAPLAEVPLNLTVKLRPGKNVLVVSAVDAGGGSRQESRVVFYDPPAAGRARPEPSPPVDPPRPIGAPPAGAPAAPAAGAPAPPIVQVTIASPADQARLQQDSIALAGMAHAGKGVSRVAVTLNGSEVSRVDVRPARPSQAINLPLTLREGGNILVVTATDVEGTTQQEVRTVHYERLVPLTVSVRYPEDRARVTEETSVLAALVTSSKGVASTRVTLNGADVHQQNEPSPPKSVALTVPLKLREGSNAIVITATEPDGATRQELRTAVYERPAGVPPPAARPGARDRWAVVVGVGRYDRPEIPRLTYAVRDAEVIYQVLTAQAGFKKENVLLLTDKTERKPTLRNLKWALGTFLARSARKDDLVVVFFAGHGAPEIDPRGVEADGLAKYLVPIDADPSDLYSTGLPMDEFQIIFNRIEAERVVVFLDACYSGAAGGRTFASQKTRAGHVDDLFLERLARSRGRAILTASRSAEVSIELPELGHGVFTHYLVQGLRGTADLDRDGIVTLQELYEYVEQQVVQKSRAVGGNQHPVMKGELEGVLPLVKVGGRP